MMFWKLPPAGGGSLPTAQEGHRNFRQMAKSKHSNQMDEQRFQKPYLSVFPMRPIIPKGRKKQVKSGYGSRESTRLGYYLEKRFCKLFPEYLQVAALPSK